MSDERREQLDHVREAFRSPGCDENEAVSDEKLRTMVREAKAPAEHAMLQSAFRAAAEDAKKQVERSADDILDSHAVMKSGDEALYEKYRG